MTLRSLLIVLAVLLTPTVALAAQVSPDGTTLTAPATGQSLTTSQGTFSFGASGFPGGYQLLINGAWTGTGSAVEYEVTNGQIYAQNNLQQWYSWGGSNWTGPIPVPVESGASPPPSTTAPTPASGLIPTPLTVSGPVTMSPTGGYVANSTVTLTAQLPNPTTVPCGLPGTYFENDGSAQLILQVPPGEVWLGEVPNSQDVYLGYQSNSGHAWCDGSSWHFGN